MDLELRRKLADAKRTIKSFLYYKGYKLDGMKDVDAIILFSDIQFGEKLTPVKSVCDEWLLEKLKTFDIYSIPHKMGSRKESTAYHLAIRQIKYYFTSKNIPIRGLNQKQLVRAFAEHRFNEIAYDFKIWLIKKINDGCTKGMPVGSRPQKKKTNRLKVHILPSNIKTDFSKDYKAFLKTDYWKSITEIVRRRDKNCCTKCGSKSKLHVHHLTYKNHMNEHEHLDDLITLCQSCHHDIHNK